MTACPLCRPHWPCPWHDADAIEHRARYDATTRDQRGHDVPIDTNGLQISMARYVQHLRERRVQTEEAVAA